MELNKIIFDPTTGFSFGTYRQRGKLVSRHGILCWLSTKHSKLELKKIYPNTSIVLLNSPGLGDFEKKFVESLIQDTRWIETEFYKIGTFNAKGDYSRSIGEGDYYIFDWKADNCFLNIKYLPLSRKDMSPRCLPLSIDVWREIRLDQIL